MVSLVADIICAWFLVFLLHLITEISYIVTVPQPCMHLFILQMSSVGNKQATGKLMIVLLPVNFKIRGFLPAATLSLILKMNAHCNSSYSAAN